jgi:hypothetical protein
LEAGLVEARAPVFQPPINADGGIEHVHTSTTPPVSLISDNELDALIASILESFPQFSRRMIKRQSFLGW